ncbi:MAG: nucleotidyltransferase domain-containing protein [Nanoarchaeota archaeon]|nr:nucleotidyltransferase domain-containing protein [Nanoarchaeota archaeon]
MKKKVISKKEKKPKNKTNLKKVPTLQLKSEIDIAMDFATKAYKKFDRMVKSIVLFGSIVKQTNVPGSDIDIVIIVDDASIKWDQNLIAWYREELANIMKASPYKRELHINTIKLSTWWEDLVRGDPVVINIIRNGEPIIDTAGFFTPFKYLLAEGKIRATPEAVYNCIQRAPLHFARSKSAELNSIEGLYWAMVDSSHAALMMSGLTPASPEHIPGDLKETFVDKGKLNMKYVIWYRDLLMLHKQISHGETRDLKGVQIDMWQDRTEDFMKTMVELVDKLVE